MKDQSILNKLKSEISNLEALISDMISDEADGSLRSNLMKSAMRKKEKFVLAVHPTKIMPIKVKRRKEIKTEYKVKIGGKYHRFANYDTAIDELYKYYTEGKEPAVQNYTFKKVYDEAIQNRIDLNAPAPSTIDRWKRTYNRFVDDEMAKTDIGTFTYKDLEKYILRMVRVYNLRKHGLSELKGMLNITFEYALSEGLIDINPVPENNHAAMTQCRPDEHRPEKKAFSKEAIKSIRNHEMSKLHAKDYCQVRNASAILLSTYTGLRVGELCALKREDIDFNRKLLHVHAQITWSSKNGKTIFAYTNSTKDEKRVSAGGRYVPLVDEAIDVLKCVIEAGGDSEWVFKQDEDYMKPNAYERALARVAKKLDLPLTNNHAIRMSFNSYELVERGINVADRASILGHSVAVNEANYTFAKELERMEELRQVMND